MANRLIKRVGVMKVYRNAEWDEYVVKGPTVVVDGYGFAASYFTDDKADALSTAAMMDAEYSEFERNLKAS